MKLLEYIEKFRQDHGEEAKIYPLAIGDNQNVYDIEIRFPANKYNINAETFKDVENFLTRRSGGVFSTATNFQDFRRGYLSLKVAFCNINYKEQKVIKTLEEFFWEVMPDLEK